MEGKKKKPIGFNIIKKQMQPTDMEALGQVHSALIISRQSSLM